MICVALCKWLHRTIFNYLQDHYCDLCGFKWLHRSGAVRIHLEVGVAGTHLCVVNKDGEKNGTDFD